MYRAIDRLSVTQPLTTGYTTGAERNPYDTWRAGFEISTEEITTVEGSGAALSEGYGVQNREHRRSPKLGAKRTTIVRIDLGHDKRHDVKCNADKTDMSRQRPSKRTVRLTLWVPLTFSLGARTILAIHSLS